MTKFIASKEVIADMARVFRNVGEIFSPNAMIGKEPPTWKWDLETKSVPRTPGFKMARKKNLQKRRIRKSRRGY